MQRSQCILQCYWMCQLGLLIWPLSLRRTQRDLVAVESRVAVLARFVWYGLTQPVVVCFLPGNKPSACVPDVQYSTESHRGSLTEEMSVLRAANPDSVTEMLALRKREAHYFLRCVDETTAARGQQSLPRHAL